MVVLISIASVFSLTNTIDLECKSFMGLLPEINRAWITIDNRLFLWNYEDGYEQLLNEKICYKIIYRKHVKIRG
jgi:hypothetical protein